MSSPLSLTCLTPTCSCAQMVKAQSVVHFLQYLPWAGEHPYIFTADTHANVLQHFPAYVRSR